MKKTSLTLMAAAALAVTCISATAQRKDPDVGGAAMYPTKTIVQNAVNSPVHKTLVAAVKAAGLVDTLNGPGPFTVFAPTDDAFAKLPARAPSITSCSPRTRRPSPRSLPTTSFPEPTAPAN